MDSLVERRIVALLGDDHTSPYGNPIPGLADLLGTADVAENFRAGLVTLSEAAGSAPRQVTVRRIGEPVQVDHEALQLLTESGVVPGSQAPGFAVSFTPIRAVPEMVGVADGTGGGASNDTLTTALSAPVETTVIRTPGRPAPRLREAKLSPGPYQSTGSLSAVHRCNTTDALALSASLQAVVGVQPIFKMRTPGAQVLSQDPAEISW